MKHELPSEQIAAIAALGDTALEAFMVDSLTNVDFPLFDAACAEIDRRRGLRWEGCEPESRTMKVRV
ncbi:MAG TPA: hypothetical protein PKZ76_14130 [Xanthomonadaceae bacterium]|nr:hypothetical protein [Xanthomonadaceae bacterium]